MKNGNIDSKNSNAELGEIIFKNLQNAINRTEQNANIVLEPMEKFSRSLKDIFKDNYILIQSLTDLDNKLLQQKNSIDKGIEQISDILSFIDKAKISVSGLDNEVRKTTDRTMKAIELFENLSRHSKSIGDIVTVVSNVAEQTTLLAFNAAIEAAKAGDYGNGFAVVADEVRNLAKTSDNNVKEIDVLINDTSNNILSITNDIHKLRLLATLNKRKTEIIGECLDKMKFFLLDLKKTSDEISLQSQEKIESIRISRSLIERINASLDSISRLSFDLTTSISDFITEISQNCDSLATKLNENFSDSPDQSIVEENIIDILDKFNLSGVTNTARKTFKSLLIDLKQKMGASEESFSEFINHLSTITKKSNDDKENFYKLSRLNSTILLEIGKIRASDHIIYNEIFQDSIRNKKIYEGQLSASRCAFGKWFLKYKPHNEREKAIYDEVAKSHEDIHKYLTESVEYMKQNRFNESEKIFTEQIIPATDEFILKLSRLIEGAVIIGTGFKYSTTLFEKINSQIHNLSVPFSKIAKVVNIIDTIRIQTNMLAVCGTIEAARAGEFGKGFSFVGSDIKNLASETKDNNEKIKDLLDQIYDLLDQAKRDFNEVNLLIISQDQEADSSLNALTQIEKFIIQAGSYADSLSSENNNLSNKIQNYLFEIDKTMQKFKEFENINFIDEQFKKFLTSIEFMEKNFSEMEMSLLK